MAKVNLNKLLEMLRGRIGNLVFRRRPDGTVIVSSKPHYKGRRKHKGTPAQKAHRQHFKEQTQLAKALVEIHPLYAELAAQPAAREKWLSAYNCAMADCLQSPVIHRIERGESCIRVEASDNVRVEKVDVTVKDEQGTVLERGSAIRGEGDWWEFPTHAQGTTIVAQAWDLPGNTARLVL